MTSLRVTYLHVTDFERLEEWCQKVVVLFEGTGFLGLFLVGSVLQRPDYRDVDLRVMLTDKAFDKAWSDPVKVRYMNRAISTWGQHELHMPIDFQIQRQTEANEYFAHQERNSMGLRDWTLQRTSGVPKP